MKPSPLIVLIIMKKDNTVSYYYTVTGELDDPQFMNNNYATYKKALQEAFQEWIDGKDDADKSKAAAEKIIPMVEAAKDKCKNCATIAEFKNYLVKKSQWIIGGDGASYDIGYGGLDHVIASVEG